METSESNSDQEFYYLIRHPHTKDVVGVYTTKEKYGKNAMFGAYALEPTTKAVLETLEEFGSLEERSLEIDEHFVWGNDLQYFVAD